MLAFFSLAMLLDTIEAIETIMRQLTIVVISLKKQLLKIMHCFK
jgi:2-phospho-L-lactate guanylyltransferase (CobY/MobA/RfbA family)